MVSRGNLEGGPLIPQASIGGLDIGDEVGGGPDRVFDVVNDVNPAPLFVGNILLPVHQGPIRAAAGATRQLVAVGKILEGGFDGLAVALIAAVMEKPAVTLHKGEGEAVGLCAGRESP